MSKSSCSALWNEAASVRSALRSRPAPRESLAQCLLVESHATRDTRQGRSMSSAACTYGGKKVVPHHSHCGCRPQRPRGTEDAYALCTPFARHSELGILPDQQQSAVPGFGRNEDRERANCWRGRCLLCPGPPHPRRSALSHGGRGQSHHWRESISTSLPFEFMTTLA